MGLGLTDLNRSGCVDPWRMKIADYPGVAITQDMKFE